MKKLLLLIFCLLTAVTVAACGNPADTGPAASSGDTTSKEDTSMKETSSENPGDTSSAPESSGEDTPTVYPLRGKTLIFLGSSVTYGSAAGGTSFVEYLRVQEKCTTIKEAVSGTTLVDNGDSSYVQRMIKNLPKDREVDHFICQLSTNDATQNKPLGRISDSKDLADFDTGTIIGAVEYIICYAKETWGCPVSFYTGTRFDNTLYGKMVDALYDLKEKWDIGIIDLWNDEEMNGISDELYQKYMSDPIHPTAEGYRVWWLPKFVEHLERYE